MVLELCSSLTKVNRLVPFTQSLLSVVFVSSPLGGSLKAVRQDKQKKKRNRHHGALRFGNLNLERTG